MKKYVITIKEDQLNIALVNVFLGKVAIDSIYEMYDETLNKLIESYSMIELDQIKEPLNNFIRTTNKTVKDVEVVLGLDSIISRSIEIPYLNRKHIRSYIANNISNFFTVDMEDYFYDYKIIQAIPKTKEEPKKLAIKLVVIPKTTIIGISKLVLSLGLKLKKIGIYPDIMQRIVLDQEAIGVIDIGVKKSLFTIYDEGATFIYTTIDNQDENKEDFADELEYFTDFFAARHQGESLGKIYLTGNQSDNIDLHNYLSERLAIHVGAIDYKRFNKIANELDMSKYPSIVLSQKKMREIHREEIDFSEDEALKVKKDRSFQPVYLFFILAVLTATWFMLYSNYLEDQLSFYKVELPDSSQYMELESTKNALQAEKEELLRVEKAIEEIENQAFDYHELLAILQKTIPDDLTISKMTMTQGTIDLSFSNIDSTMDLLELVIALNRTERFEPIQIENMALNDNLDGYEIQLIPVSEKVRE